MPSSKNEPTVRKQEVSSHADKSVQFKRRTLQERCGINGQPISNGELDLVGASRRYGEAQSQSITSGRVKKEHMMCWDGTGLSSCYFRCDERWNHLRPSHPGDLNLQHQLDMRLRRRWIFDVDGLLHFMHIGLSALACPPFHSIASTAEFSLIQDTRRH